MPIQRRCHRHSPDGTSALMPASAARRQLPFPGDERDRYASRFHAIAAQHGGVFSRFVEEPPAREETHGD